MRKSSPLVATVVILACLLFADLIAEADPPPIGTSTQVEWRGLILSRAVEAADVIQITCQVVDETGTNVSQQREYVALLTSGGTAVPLGDALAFHIGVDTGNALTLNSQPRLAFRTDGTGLAILDVTDVVGASGGNLRIEISSLDQQGNGALPDPLSVYAGSLTLGFN